MLKTIGWGGLAVLAAVLTSGCAVEHQDSKALTTQSLKPAAEARAQGKSPDETMRAFCSQRHIDHATGKPPGGATSLDRKQADDRLCEAIGRQS